MPAPIGSGVRIFPNSYPGGAVIVADPQVIASGETLILEPGVVVKLEAGGAWSATAPCTCGDGREHRSC